MKNYFKLLYFLLLALLPYSLQAASQKLDGLYISTYGDKSNSAAIFIHGGPGYDSQDFEITTAELLASKGFYVVVYDQRGQGRSDLAKDYTDYTYM